MEFLMIFMGKCYQIFRSIVRGIAVDMVDNLIRLKSATVVFFPNKAVFDDISLAVSEMVPWQIKKSISLNNFKPRASSASLPSLIMSRNKTHWISAVLISPQNSLFGKRCFLTATTFTKSTGIEIWRWLYGYFSTVRFTSLFMRILVPWNIFWSAPTMVRFPGNLLTTTT